MMNRILFTASLLLILNSLPFAQEYEGKYKGHPNLAKVKKLAAATAEDAPKGLPRWLCKKTPEITVHLVDATDPLAPLAWPGSFRAAYSIRSERKAWAATIELPIDSLIHDPDLVEPALRRQIFGVAAARKELEAGVSLMDLGEQGLTNPLIDVMAAHWAGSLDAEIHYGLSRHLEDEEKVLGLVTDIELTENGADLAERAEGDLTLLMLAKVLAPKRDRKLEKLFESMTRTQPLEQGLEKASGTSLQRLNQALHKALDSYLDDTFPERDREAYRRAYEAYHAQRWEDVILELTDIKETSLAGPNSSVFLAVATSELDPGPVDEKVRELHQSMLEAASRNSGGTPFTAEAQERLGHYLLELGDLEAAVRAFATLRDGFGWQPGVEERAMSLLESVNRK